jgi:toxin-antitoxin system PIN domain toxin
VPGPRLAFDTNILFYAVNEDSPFHAAASEFLRSIRDDDGVVLSELVLIELYRLLRNPVINEHPLDAGAAADLVQTYRRHPHWLLVALPMEQRRVHDRLWQVAAEPGFPYRRIFDARLALSLIQQGVSRFATVNVKDFRNLGFRRVWNPLEAAETNSEETDSP